MSSQPTRRAPWTRLLVALAAVAVLAVAALLMRGTFTAPHPSRAGDARGALTSATGVQDHSTPSLHVYRPVAVMRTRGVALAMLAVATAIAACVSRRVRINRSERRRTLRVTGLPLGRAPPRLRIA
jgi:hypothetical protein